MDDAALVQAARSGDGAAWGAIYDRYADKLHDHCHRILRDRDEAADALHDAFLAASAHLDQLRDPSRLRPWLYSICRHEALKRARRRNRIDVVDDVEEMTGVEVDMDRGARAEELHELVWSAAAGLNERDRALLDLNVRQGLEGQDLADAMGTSLSSSYVMLSRLRDQVERSLGALLIARLGREDCEELGALLVGWDGTFSPILRKRVARHVDGCEVCSERRAAVVSPLALLAAAPLVPAPASLRTRVLDGIGSRAPVEPISFTRDGFAAPDGRERLGRGWLVTAVALLVLGLVGVLLSQSGDDPAVLLAAGGEATTTTTDAVTTTEPDAASTSTTSTTVPAVAPPSNDPEAPPATPDPAVIPAPTAPPADTTPPSIGGVAESEPAIQATGPGCTDTSTITASITDAASVRLRWTGSAADGQAAMTRSGSSWAGTLGPFTNAPTDTITYTITATDAAGNQSTRTGTISITPCPQ